MLHCKTPKCHNREASNTVNYSNDNLTVLFTTDLPHPYNKIGDGPEGPEARTVSDKLRPVLTNCIITKASKDDRGKSIGFDNIQCPVVVVDVRSYGKKVLIYLDSQHTMVVSLGMGGRFQYQAGNHSHIFFDVSKQVSLGLLRVLTPLCTLFFDDPRYMGSIDIIPNAGIPTYFSSLGPDLLELSLNKSTWIPLDKWIELFNPAAYPNRAICSVLQNQEIVAGIGNYLKSEILYYSGVLPNRLLGTITVEEWDLIRIKSHEVIALAYSYGGFTIESFISPDGQLGQYPAAVYGRSHDNVGNPVVHGKTKDNRTSHWVPLIQR